MCTLYNVCTCMQIACQASYAYFLLMRATCHGISGVYGLTIFSFRAHLAIMLTGTKLTQCTCTSSGMCHFRLPTEDSISDPELAVEDGVSATETSRVFYLSTQSCNAQTLTWKLWNSANMLAYISAINQCIDLLSSLITSFVTGNKTIPSTIPGCQWVILFNHSAIKPFSSMGYVRWSSLWCWKTENVLTC